MMLRAIIMKIIIRFFLLLLKYVLHNTDYVAIASKQEIFQARFKCRYDTVAMIGE